MSARPATSWAARALSLAASLAAGTALALSPAPMRSAQAAQEARVAALPVAAVEPAPASAARELWSYVDARGVVHFAERQLDSRYARVLADRPSLHVPGKKDGPEHLLTWLEFSPDVLALQPVLKEAAKHAGVDEELLKAVIAVESRFNAKAVSPQGAVGLMQLTPTTADRYATRAERQTPAAQRLLDARINVFTGARMLADLTRRYGSIDVALAAWNAGEGNVRKAGGRVPPNAETEAHVHLVLELYWALLQRSLGAAARGLQLHDATRD